MRYRPYTYEKADNCAVILQPGLCHGGEARRSGSGGGPVPTLLWRDELDLAAELLLEIVPIAQPSGLRLRDQLVMTDAVEFFGHIPARFGTGNPTLQGHAAKIEGSRISPQRFLRLTRA